MKFTNRGHQFDKIGTTFSNYKYLCIYGCGNRGKEAYAKITQIDSGILDFFVDENEMLQKSGYQGKNVISFQTLSQNYNCDDVLVIVSPADSHVIKCNLLARGFSFFDSETFFQLYYHIFLLYAHNILCLPEMTVSVTDNCSLKCKSCSFGGYSCGDNQFENQLSTIKLLFENVDYIERLAIVGGEPFLDRNLSAFLNYLYKYNSQIGETRIVTNLFANIDDNVLDTIKSKGIKIEYTNYSNQLTSRTDITDVIQNNVSRIIERKIPLTEVNHQNWVDFGIINGKITNSENLEYVFDKCRSMCRVIRNGKLIQCYPGFCQSNQNNYDELLDLNFESDRKKHIIYEFYYGFCEKGYIDACKFCNGSFNTNRNFVTPGMQYPNG
jgi:organic radical activating enzyme